jgi:DNA-binding helix-hairpin-helix protein with protein kinase domain
MRPPVKFVPAASAALIGGTLISVGVAFVTRDLTVPAPQLAQGVLKTGEEAPRITRERQQVDADVVAVVAPPSGGPATAIELDPRYCQTAKLDRC